MPDESRILKPPRPIMPFHGVVKPGIAVPRGTGLRKPERGETTPLPAMRVEACRQWLTRQSSTQAHQTAEVLVEQYCRLDALRQVVKTLPDGALKSKLLGVLNGNLIVYQV